MRNSQSISAVEDFSEAFAFETREQDEGALLRDYYSCFGWDSRAEAEWGMSAA